MPAPGGGGLLVLKADDTIFEVEIGGSYREIPGLASMRETVGEPETTTRQGFRGRTSTRGTRPDSTMVCSGAPVPYHSTYKAMEAAEAEGDLLNFRCKSEGVTVHTGAGSNKVSWTNQGVVTFAGEDPSKDPAVWFIEGSTIVYVDSGDKLVLIDKIEVKVLADGTHTVTVVDTDGSAPDQRAAVNYSICSPPPVWFDFAAIPGVIPKMDRSAEGGEDVSWNLFLNGGIKDTVKAK